MLFFCVRRMLDDKKLFTRPMMMFNIAKGQLTSDVAIRRSGPCSQDLARDVTSLALFLIGGGLSSQQKQQGPYVPRFVAVPAVVFRVFSVSMGRRRMLGFQHSRFRLHHWKYVCGSHSRSSMSKQWF